MLFQFNYGEENFVFFLIKMETLFILFVFTLFVATLMADPKHRYGVIKCETVPEAMPQENYATTVCKRKD